MQGFKFYFWVQLGYEDFIDTGNGLLSSGGFAIFSFINSVEQRVHED